jgi:hypothetical protein
MTEDTSFATDYAALHLLAQATVATAAVKPGEQISTGVNTTGHLLHLPGGSGHYPAFWVRDAAMMLGDGFIPAEEIEGWIRLIASTQPGPQVIPLEHNLSVPGFSIPDHINVNGKPVWFPGTYSNSTDQGNGQYGCLPPADDAFYFIQMVWEHFQLAGSTTLLKTPLSTGWGEHPLLEICDRAFESVAVDPATGIVIGGDAPGQTRVDWGFCDSVRKTGLLLFPTILRFRAANDLAALHEATGGAAAAARYRQIAAQLRVSVAKVFLRNTGENSSMLLSATVLGRKDDVWGSSFAVAEHLLEPDAELAVCRGLLALHQASGIVAEGQVRGLPPDGPFGGFWESCAAPPGEYQNGTFWGTMSGWLIVALHRVDPAAARTVLHDLVASITADKNDGGPWEWIHPAKNLRRNPNYCSTVSLPCAALRRSGLVGKTFRSS